MKLVKRKNKNQKSEHRVKRNKSFIISIIAVILVSIFLYPVAMKNPHIRNMERLIEDEVEGNDFTLECGSKRNELINGIALEGEDNDFRGRNSFKKINNIQKMIHNYVLENPEGFSLRYSKFDEEDEWNRGEKGKYSVFSLYFTNRDESYYDNSIMIFGISENWKERSGRGFSYLALRASDVNRSQYKFSFLSVFTEIKEMFFENIEIDMPDILCDMKDLQSIYLKNCTGDIEGLKEKAKEMNIECEIEQ